MLGSHPVDVMLLATDLGVARSFYGDVLGLEVLVANEGFLTFGCGGASRLVVTKSTTGTADQVTKASWRVEDLAGEVAWLRARGVPVQDLPELGTVDGIADLGFALAAWFIDPHHNWIGLLQLKDPSVRTPGAAVGAGQAGGADAPGAEPAAGEHRPRSLGPPPSPVAPHQPTP